MIDNSSLLRVYYRLPPLTGGMEAHIAALSKFQTTQIPVYTAFNRGEKIYDTDIQVLRSWDLHKTRPRCIGILIFYVFLIVKLARSTARFGTIHIHGDWSSLILLPLLKWVTGASCTVFSFHGGLQNTFSHRSLLPRLVRSVDTVFATGGESARLLQQWSARRVVFQPSGGAEDFYTETQLTAKEKDGLGFSVITVCHIRPKKNLKLILELAERLPHFRFTIVGDGPQRVQLETQIAERALSNVAMYGNLTRPDVIEVVRTKHCFLLTSMEEGTPTTIMEAMALGLPVITARVGGIESIVIDGKNGFIVDGYRPADYVKALRILESNRGICEKFGKANLAKAEAFRWNHVAARIKEEMHTSDES